jgi:hypothetical protein
VWRCCYLLAIHVDARFEARSNKIENSNISSKTQLVRINNYTVTRTCRRSRKQQGEDESEEGGRFPGPQLHPHFWVTHAVHMVSFTLSDTYMSWTTLDQVKRRPSSCPLLLRREQNIYLAVRQSFTCDKSESHSLWTKSKGSNLYILFVFALGQKWSGHQFFCMEFPGWVVTMNSLWPLAYFQRGAYQQAVADKCIMTNGFFYLQLAIFLLFSSSCFMSMLPHGLGKWLLIKWLLSLVSASCCWQA